MVTDFIAPDVSAPKGSADNVPTETIVFVTCEGCGRELPVCMAIAVIRDGHVSFVGKYLNHKRPPGVAYNDYNDSWYDKLTGKFGQAGAGEAGKWMRQRSGWYTRTFRSFTLTSRRCLAAERPGSAAALSAGPAGAIRGAAQRGELVGDCPPVGPGNAAVSQQLSLGR